MYDNILVVTYTPDKPGRGGTKTGFHSFSEPPWLDTRETYNFNVLQNRWRKDTQSIPPTDATSGLVNGAIWSNATNDYNSTYTYSLHSYVTYATTDIANPAASPIVEILSHESVGGPTTLETSSRIWSHYYSGSGLLHSMPANATVPAEYLNIGARCLYTLGGAGEGRVRYRTGTLATDVTDYPIGVEAPGATLTTTIRTTTAVRHAAYTTPDADFVNAPDNNLDGYGGAGITIDGKLNGTYGPVTLSAGTAINITGIGTGIQVSVVRNSYIVSFASGADLISALSTTRCEGLLFTLNGQQCIIAQQGNSPIADMVASNEIALAEPYLGPDATNTSGWSITGSQALMSGGGVTIPSFWASVSPGFSYKSTGLGYTAKFLPCFVYGGGGSPAGLPMTWDGPDGPTWAYAFYDPTSGHVSNIGSTYQAGDLGGSGIIASATFSTDPGLFSAPDSDHNTRFSHTLLFRTIAGGGSVLFPVGSIQPKLTVPSGERHNPRWRGIPNAIQPTRTPATGGDAWGLEDCYPNTELLESGALIAPQFTNGPPSLIENNVSTVLYPKFWEFWDGRLWMVGTQDPRAVHFSCDRVQCQFGRPEESYPDTNRLPLSAADGFVRGLELCGNMLVITTDRYAYYIAGNNETNYRMMRLSTDMYGVGEYQMDEFAGETENTAAIIVFLGRDNRLYMTQPGSEPVWLSAPIQDKLDASIVTLADYMLCRVHTTNIGGRKRIIVRVPKATSQTYNLFVYDVDTQTWTSKIIETSNGSTLVPQSFATVYGGVTVPINEIYGYNGDIGSWLRTQNLNDSKFVMNAKLYLFPSAIDGKKTRKMLQFIRVYCNGVGATGLAAWVYVDESSQPCLINCQAQEDTAYSIIDPTGNPVDGMYTRELIGFVADAAVTSGYGPPLIGYRFAIEIDAPGDQYGTEIYAVQIGYSLAEEPEEVDP
jgi:hypothetical protein